MSPLSYLLIVGVIVLENAGLPLPGEIVISSAASLLGGRPSSLILLLLAAAGTAVVGDSIAYAAGRRFGERFLAALDRWVCPSGQGRAWVERIFTRSGLLVIPLSRFVVGVRVFTAPLAGTARVPYRKFFLLDMLGALLWATTCVGIGLLGASLAPQVNPWTWAIAIILVGSSVLALITSRVVLPVPGLVPPGAVEMREGGDAR